MIDELIEDGADVIIDEETIVEKVINEAIEGEKI